MIRSINKGGCTEQTINYGLIMGKYYGRRGEILNEKYFRDNRDEANYMYM